MRTVLLAAIAGCRAGAFACEDDQQCNAGDAQGVCQPEGVCSFPDDVCASGQRYGDHSGELSGHCVPVGGTASSSGMAESVGPQTVAESVEVSSADLSSTIDPESSSSRGAEGSSSTGADDSEASSTGEPGDPSLLLWFRFDDELSDGLANDGALGGVAACSGESCPTAIEGPVGVAGSFDGLDDCGLVEHTAALNAPQFTLAMWARRDVAVLGFDAAFTKPVGATPYNTWRMTVQGDELLGELLNVHVGTSDDSGVDSYAPLPLGMWRHFAATWDGTVMHSYLDGLPFESFPSMLIEIDDSPVYVGCDDDAVPRGLVHHLHGALDDVRMYDRVLDEAEIAELHALGAP